MSETMRPLRLGAERSWGETRCQFGLERPECDQAATHHVMWLEDNHTSATCAEHLDFIRSRAQMPYEVHTHGPDCGMPGSLWHHPYEDEDQGYCLFPAPDDASVVAFESTPMEANA